MNANESDKFILTGAREIIALSGETLQINRQVEMLESALSDNPGLAFDLAKALIETVCRTILRERGRTPDVDWDCPRLLKETTLLVQLVPPGHSSPGDTTEQLKKITGGMQQIIGALCFIRNREGFASHGHDGSFIGLDGVHALLVAKTTDAIVEFIYKAHKNAFAQRVAVKVPQLGDEPEFNQYVDDAHDEIRIFSATYKPSEVLFRVDSEAYKGNLDDFKAQPPDAE
jgi:hypothetical protein